MNNFTATDPYHGTTYKRIRKDVARRLWNKGTEILIQAVNMRPFNNWQSPFKTHRFKTLDSFDEMINEYEYYNTGAKLGDYAAFYVETS